MIKFYVPKTGKPVYRHIILLLKEYSDEAGQKLGETFTKLPTKTEMPEYYKMIKEPIDLSKIEGRIIGNQYRENQAFQAAVEMMFANAREFNDPDSSVFADATKLRDFARRELYRVTQRGIPQGTEWFACGPLCFANMNLSSSVMGYPRHRPAVWHLF